MKQRRVGTFTLGIVLIVFGVMFIAHMFISTLKYSFIFSMWPVIFLVLGGEILYYAVRYKDESFKYDFAAIFIICMLLVFAMGMAGVDWIMQNYPGDITW